MIAVGQSAPPVRITAGRWRQNAMERIANVVCKFAVGFVHVTVTGVTKLLGKLESGNRVFWRAAMRPEHCQFFFRNAVSVTHCTQRSLELLDCRYWGWVTVCVHNFLQKQSVRVISNQFNNSFEPRNICSLRFIYYKLGFTSVNRLHDVLATCIDHVTDFTFFSVFGSSANQCGSRYASVKSCPHGYGWQYQCNYAAQQSQKNAWNIIPV